MRTDRFVEVMGYRIRCRAEGSGPPLILIHGIGASLEYWNWTIPALRDHYTTIAFDVPGFGQSDPIEWANTPNGATKAVLELMDALGIRTAVFVGSSLGGGIATMVAGSAPERVTALVLAAPAGFGVRVNPLLRVSTLPWLGEGLLALAARNPYLALRDVFADQRRIPNGLIEIFRRDAARPVTGQTYLKTLRTSVTLRGIRPEIVRHMRTAAAQISAPTLIVWGTKDRIIPSDQAPVAARTIPGARLQMMTGLGHVPYLEAPDAFNTVLAAFLFDVARPVEAPAAH